MVKKILLFFIILGTILVMWIYVCFCNFSQIGIDTYTNPTTWHDTIVHIQDVLKNYPKTMFIYKGRSFGNLPCRDLSTGKKKYVADICFNWDNTITYRIDGKKGNLRVDSVNITTQAYKPLDTIFWKCASNDSIFYIIKFFDKNNNSIKICRQKRRKPYGGKRNGLYIDIGKYDIGTGKVSTSPFDY